MEQFEPEPGAAEGRHVYAAELAAMRARLHDLDLDTVDPAVENLVQDLETSYEELRVADEEVRVQQDHIAQLLEGQHLLRWQHERMVAVLPVPVLMTDKHGLISSVNASAAGLVQMRVARMIGKPVLALIAPADRSDVRRLLGKLAGGGSNFHRVVTVLASKNRPISAELYVSKLPGPSPEISWMLLVGANTERPAYADGRSVPESLARLALLPTQMTDDHEVLSRAAAICQECLGPSVVLSLSMGPPDDPAALSSTSQVAQAFDGAQLAAGEGPCVTAYADVTVVETEDVHTDPRWPRLSEYAPSAVRGVVAAPLEVGDDLVGAFNVYVIEPTSPPRLREDTELLAATVAAVMFELGLKHELESVASGLEQALQSRATIDQAKGIVMAHRGVGPEEAFEHLVRLSSTQHVKLRDLAEEMVRRAGQGPSARR